MSLPVDVLLCETELEIRGDANLLLDEVDARHRLGDRMLDLQPSVDLEEVEVAVAEDELDRPGVDVTRRFRGADCRVAHGRANRRGEGRRGRLFHDLLVPALDRAFALAQVRRVAVAVADHLDLDVPRVANVPLEVHGCIAEG